MKKVNVDEFKLYGISAKTDNQSEMNPEVAKIGSLWQNFYGELAQNGVTPTVAYGVYSEYESDQNGEYRVSACTKDDAGLNNQECLTIPAGNYLCFEKSGELPAAALELWQEIWDYFEQDSSPKRTFQFDYEQYLSFTDIAIYIGIEG